LNNESAESDAKANEQGSTLRFGERRLSSKRFVPRWMFEHQEFVRLVFFEERAMAIAVTTLSQQSVRIKPGRWRHKWSLIGEGKIVFTTFVRGTPHTLTLRIYPVSERTFLQTMFLAGKNGPFGARSDMVFSAIVEESDDKASFGIDV